MSVTRLNQLQPQAEEGRGLEDPPLKVLQAEGSVQQLPLPLVWEVGVYEVLRVGEEVEVIEPVWVGWGWG